ncbi:mCG146098, isoform CRA_a, partial [Mus musculus]
ATTVGVNLRARPARVGGVPPGPAHLQEGHKVLLDEATTPGVAQQPHEPRSIIMAGSPSPSDVIDRIDFLRLRTDTRPCAPTLALPPCGLSLTHSPSWVPSFSARAAAAVGRRG